MILVVNLNLAVDYVVRVGKLVPGGVHRSESARRQPGGKGVNAARVLKALGEPALLTGFLGWRAGDEIAEGLRAEGVEFDCVRVCGESRTCLVLCDDAGRAQTVVNEPGPPVDAGEWEDFNETYARLVPDSTLVIITGSLPPGLAPDSYARLVRTARAFDRRVLLDCSAAALAQALAAAPYLVKINHTEAAELLRRPVEDFDGAVAAASELIRMGAGRAMVTLGALGAALVDEGVAYRLAPPRVEATNSVGSGDAALAGLAAALRRGQTTEAAAVLAVAAGAANALHGLGACTSEEVEEMRARVTCEVGPA